MKIIGVIPSRLSSSRLPNKPMKEISGIPMIAHVIQRSKLAKSLDELYLVTDSVEISEVAKKYNCKFLLTKNDHKTGTDRIGEIVENLNADIIVNIQGDEALVTPEDIDASSQILVKREDIDIGMLVTKFKNANSPSDVKVAINIFNEIIFFSRSDIPFNFLPNKKSFLKAYHVVSFRKEALKRFCVLDQTPIEKIESIEYMRAIENGIKIGCTKVESKAISVDTERDLELVRELMKTDQLAKLYLNYSNE
ncbi:MAG: 3-deoxy-manno-octulosonate cytidylyltransferase [Rickettsiales bacterium TMED289]|nr:MAG: 3-deoxy-manno-octulosonate cytidylyltransferase [Rickettsiales bacterium TMED289]|tara:strand:+ start:1677 stop:2429 length:753 start_codon:yes stop_codon:yes gene_type:complete